MKKQILFLLLCTAVSFATWSQSKPSISFTSVPTSTPIGTVLKVSYKYTMPTAGQVTCGISLFNDWTWISTVNYAGLNPAPAGKEITGVFNIEIPKGTKPTANLTGKENYKINVELKDATGNYLTGDYSIQNYNLTVASENSVNVVPDKTINKPSSVSASTKPSISFTSVPTSTPIGTVLKVSYKYTMPIAGQVTCGISLFNDWTWISTVNYAGLNPAPAGTDVTGTFNITIPEGTKPTANLTGKENYKINVELKDASGNYLTGDYSVQNYNLIAALVPAVSFTSAFPISTEVGNVLRINYKYTATVKSSLNCSINLLDDWSFVSLVASKNLKPAVVGTDVEGFFDILIPKGTKPTATLTGNLNYKIALELKTLSDNTWLVGNYPAEPLNLVAPK
jgi:rRNA maturation endonuclease Nob1